MKKNLLLVVVVVGCLLSLNFPGPAASASPFADSTLISGDQTTGDAGETAPPPDSGIALPPTGTSGGAPKATTSLVSFPEPVLGVARVGSEKVQLATTATKKNAPAKKWEIRIPDFIIKILSWFGVKLPIGSKITINIGGGTTSTPPKPPKPPTTTQPKPPTNVNLPKTISALKTYMKQHFGITARDGDGATWSQRQLEEANKVLTTLPSSFVSNTKTIARDAIFQSKGVLGYVRMGVPTVHLLNSSTYQGTFQGTLVHEMTHCFQASHSAITQSWEKTFWPYGKIFGARPRSVSSYGNSSPLEDMAESVRTYWQSGSKMKSQQPKRYEFIKKYVMNGKEY